MHAFLQTLVREETLNRPLNFVLNHGDLGLIAAAVVVLTVACFS
jgi:hypothetical protein